MTGLSKCLTLGSPVTLNKTKKWKNNVFSLKSNHNRSLLFFSLLFSVLKVERRGLKNTLIFRAPIDGE